MIFILEVLLIMLWLAVGYIILTFVVGNIIDGWKDLKDKTKNL